MSRVRALQNCSGIILSLIPGRSLIMSFSRAFSELSFEKIFNLTSHNSREIFLGYSHLHSYGPSVR